MSGCWVVAAVTSAWRRRFYLGKLRTDHLDPRGFAENLDEAERFASEEDAVAEALLVPVSSDGVTSVRVIRAELRGALGLVLEEDAPMSRWAREALRLQLEADDEWWRAR